MMHLCLKIAAYLLTAALVEAAPQPQVLTYGHDRAIPLPGLTGGSDFAFVDWNADGLMDILATPNGEEIILRRNIGSPKDPLFANVYQEEPVVLKDSRVGRFFDLIRLHGMNRAESELPAIISFEKHGSIKAIGQSGLPLNLFIPHNTSAGIEWTVVPARWPDGSPLEAFADTWICPTLAVVDWDHDGREDLLVGGWHPSIAQPRGNYTAGFNHPQDSWNAFAGRLYLMRNQSTGNRLIFDRPVIVEVEGKPLETYGFIYPQTADLDGDGLFDLLIGEQRPGLRWYRNVGTPENPSFSFAGLLTDGSGQTIESVLSLRAYFADLDGDECHEMITTSYFAFSMGLLRFDKVEPGVNSTGWKYAGMLPMRGGKNTPVTAQGICTVEVTDWNNDGLRDLLLGAEPGTPMIMLNKGTQAKPQWDVPQRIRFVNGDPLEYYGIEVGRGSVWGPIEYFLERTLPRLADWDGDGVEDLVTGSMAARLLWLRGQHVANERRFERPQALFLDGQPLDVAHRVQPVVRDFNQDSFLDVVALDTHNVVTLWYGKGTSTLNGSRQFDGPDGQPLRLNPSEMTVVSGRRGLDMVDWNLDGVLDLVTYNAFGPTVWGGEVRLHLGDPEHAFRFQAAIALFETISHHNGGVTIIDWDEDGYLDILVGGDNNHLRRSSDPCGQFFVFSGHELPIPPAKRGEPLGPEPGDRTVEGDLTLNRHRYPKATSD